MRARWQQKMRKTSAPTSPVSRLPGLQPHAWLLATLSKDDDRGSENNGKKMNLRSFKLSTFLGVEFLRILLRLKKMKGNSSKYVHVLHKGYVTIRDDSQRRFLA